MGGERIHPTHAIDGEQNLEGGGSLLRAIPCDTQQRDPCRHSREALLEAGLCGISSDTSDVQCCGPLAGPRIAKCPLLFHTTRQGRARSILTGNLLLLILTGGVFAAAPWCGGNGLLAQRFKNPAVRDLLLMYSPYAMLALPVGAVNACLLSCGRTNTSAVFHVLTRTLTLVCVVGLVLVWRIPHAAIAGTVVAELAVFLVALLLMYRVARGRNGGRMWRICGNKCVSAFRSVWQAWSG